MAGLVSPAEAETGSIVGTMGLMRVPQNGLLGSCLRASPLLSVKSSVKK